MYGFTQHDDKKDGKRISLRRQDFPLWSINNTFVPRLFFRSLIKNLSPSPYGLSPDMTTSPIPVYNQNYCDGVNVYLMMVSSAVHEENESLSSYIFLLLLSLRLIPPFSEAENCVWLAQSRNEMIFFYFSYYYCLLDTMYVLFEFILFCSYFDKLMKLRIMSRSFSYHFRPV